jgi:biopolymer transport protein ExbD
MVRISLTPIIDVVFILLIFFMLATNFQSFNKTDIKLSNESASISESDKQIYLVEFNKKGEYKLNNKSLSLVDVKNKIVEGIKENEDEYMVVIKGSKDTDVQDVLNVIAKFKINQINNITLGISKNDLEDESDKKEKVHMPLLRKL